MITIAPFKAKMDAVQFTILVESLRRRPGAVRSLEEAYALAEAVHEGFYNQRRYSEFKTFEQSYYRRVRAELKTKQS